MIDALRDSLCAKVAGDCSTVQSQVELFSATAQSEQQEVEGLLADLTECISASPSHALSKRAAELMIEAESVCTRDQPPLLNCALPAVRTARGKYLVQRDPLSNRFKANREVGT